MSRQGAAAPLIAGGFLALAAVVALLGALGLTPSFGTATVGGAPTRGGGPWIDRLGLSQLEPWSSPTPAFADRLATLGDRRGSALKRDLCRGAGMDADPAFREARRALVRNDPGLCPAPVEHLTSVSPVIVGLGPRLGWPLLAIMTTGGLGLGLWRLAVLKQAHDRWRLLGRSTFGAARRAGTG